MSESVARVNKELLKGINPQGVFEFFAELSSIPRCSGNTAAVADYLENFSRERCLECLRDQIGNIIIRKPAQKSASTIGVILQAHQDMVCVKDAGSAHNFCSDPIRLKIDGDWLMAEGTTLGADDGIGVATALAILDDQNLVHPPLEALFTVDEETTMAGAMAIKAEQLRGEILINIDAEELVIANISSAAGAGYTLSIPVSRQAEIKGGLWRLIISGLKGGHSGSEINQEVANAFVLAARVLGGAIEAGFGFGLCSLSNGSMPGAENAIALRAEAVLSLDSPESESAMRADTQKWAATFKKEFRATDPDIKIELKKDEAQALLPLTVESRDRLLAAIRLMPHGVIRFVQEEDFFSKPYGQRLVETSNNLGVIETKEDEVLLKFMARGSVASCLDDLSGRLKILTGLVGGSLTENSYIAGWEMAVPPDRIQKLFAEQGWSLLGIHAGLECGTIVGIMAQAGKHLEAISIGPDLFGVHTTQEKLSLSSVEKFWEDLTMVLAEL